MSDEMYYGYANRETWAFNLHWQNDQGLYELVREWGGDANSTDPWTVGEHVIACAQEFWSEVGGGMWRSETGSLWRVDRHEVGEDVLEALDNG